MLLCDPEHVCGFDFKARTMAQLMKITRAQYKNNRKPPYFLNDWIGFYGFTILFQSPVM